MSLAELLSGHKIRTRLPELVDVHVEQKVRDGDREQKSKRKSYADTRRDAKHFLYKKLVPGLGEGVREGLMDHPKIFVLFSHSEKKNHIE